MAHHGNFEDFYYIFLYYTTLVDVYDRNERHISNTIAACVSACLFHFFFTVPKCSQITFLLLHAYARGSSLQIFRFLICVCVLYVLATHARSYLIFISQLEINRMCVYIIIIIIIIAVRFFFAPF